MFDDEAMAIAKVASQRDELALVHAVTAHCTNLIADRGSCIMFKPRADVGAIVYSTSVPTLRNSPVLLEYYPEVTAAAGAHHDVLVHNVHSDPLLAPVRSRLPKEVKSSAVFPLVAGDQCLGVLLFQKTSSSGFENTQAIESVHRAATILATYLVLGRFGFHSAEPTRAESSQSRRHEGSRILIIEDDSDQASLVAELLGEQGFDVRTLPDGARALNEVRSRSPDLVLLDVRLPGSDGFQVAAELRSDEATCDVPILFFSASHDLSSRVRSAPLSNLDFITKPYSPEELVARVSRALQRERERRELRRAAAYDELTGLANIRMLRERTDQEEARHRRYGTPVSMVMIDLDKLKAVNDTYGHAAGSALIASVGGVLRRRVRANDLAVRYGGDEFVVMLCGTANDEAVAFAERALADIRALPVGATTPTASIGVATLDHLSSLTEVLRRADAAAYYAKHQGGNRVQSFDGAVMGDSSARTMLSSRTLTTSES